MAKMKLPLNILTVILLLSCSAENDFTIGGSSSMSAIINLAVDEYNSIFPQSNLNYLTLSSRDALTALQDGRLQMAFSSRELTKEEEELGFFAIPLAEDPIILIGNPDLPVENLRFKDLKEYLSGDSAPTFWKDIRFVHREADSGTRDSLLRLLEIQDQDNFSPSLVAYTNQEMIQKVILNPGALGYISYSYTQEALRLGIKPLSLDGQKPWLRTDDLISYPLARSLYLILKSQNSIANLPDKSRTGIRYFITLLTWEDIQSQWENLGVLTINLDNIQELLDNIP
jgi:ABC-type phosphate transport system substrate-binding protein